MLELVYWVNHCTSLFSVIKRLQQIVPNCSTYQIFYVVGNLFGTASFFNVLAVSVDRFLAIHLHLRYQELVTHKCVVAVVISIWVLSIFIPFLMFSVPSDAYSFINGITGVIGFILITIVYNRIYLSVRRHKNQIQVLQVQQITQTGEVADFASLVKSAVGTFYVCLVFLLCYIPYVISVVATEMKGPSIVLNRFSLFSFTIAFFNSSLNPVIYCWKMRHIRHAVINILRNMSWQKSRIPRNTCIGRSYYAMIQWCRCFQTPYVYKSEFGQLARQEDKLNCIISDGCNTSKTCTE